MSDQKRLVSLSMFQCDHKSKYCILDTTGNSDVFFLCLNFQDGSTKSNLCPVCVCALSQAQLDTSEQEIQEMIRHRIRKIEEIGMSVNELEVEQTNSMTNL